MNTHADIAQILRSFLETIPIELCGQSQIAQHEIDDALSGEDDFKVSTLLSLIDRLGLELMLVPKVTEPLVKSRVQTSIE